MEEVEKEVKLHGMWCSPFALRVELALKVKGIEYEYIEEDLSQKSELLLKYNPVQKKVPVLVHNGNPVAESLVILEYIDETWRQEPRFLPDDPYKRSKVRFWANFLHQQLFESMMQVMKSEGEAQERAKKEVDEKLKMLEEVGIGDLFPAGFGHGSISPKNLGLQDIVMCSVLSSYKILEEAIGVSLVDPEKNPGIVSWVAALNELSAVKQKMPPHAKTVAQLQFYRQNALNKH
ncbi:Glutathione transferase [Bertholletia excelsa]